MEQYLRNDSISEIVSQPYAVRFRLFALVPWSCLTGVGPD
jgi:hypothetical protein